MRMRSPRTLQQMQPLFISNSSSSLWMTSWLSTPTSPYSFSITAMRRPCCSVRMRLRSVVLPAPRKPVRTVTGIGLDMNFSIFDFGFSMAVQRKRKSTDKSFPVCAIDRHRRLPPGQAP